MQGVTQEEVDEYFNRKKSQRVLNFDQEAGEMKYITGKQKKEQFGTCFYKFQAKEQSSVEELRKSFAEDKKRLAKILEKKRKSQAVAKNSN